MSERRNREAKREGTVSSVTSSQKQHDVTSAVFYWLVRYNVGGEGAHTGCEYQETGVTGSCLHPLGLPFPSTMELVA